MPFIKLSKSVFLENSSPTTLYYREYGSGMPLVFLHSGWGYEVYNFEKQIELLQKDFRIIIPDRSGYGRSTKLDSLPEEFHSLAAKEMQDFLAALGIEKALLWGHSDGAVIAAIMALTGASGVYGLILEAFHYFRAKRSSLDFFQSMKNSPEDFGEKICNTLAIDHGQDYWRKVLSNAGIAWLEIIKNSDKKIEFYNGKISELLPPTIFIHGTRDLRTEPKEMETLQKMLPQASYYFLTDIGHSPHNSSKGSKECNQIATDFLMKIKRSNY
jgi:pimeloyl-ACP methyl ester carboxylesterase